MPRPNETYKKVFQSTDKLRLDKPIDKINAYSEQTFINDWLQKRKSTGNFDNQLGGMEYNRQITNLYNAKKINDFDFYKNIMSDNNANPKKVPDMAAMEMLYNVQNGIYGAYNSNRNELWANDYQDSTNALHEYTHSLNATPQETMISKVIPKTDNYWDDPSEIYSRLMEFRKKNNIDPLKNYSIDEVTKFKNDASNDKLFDTYTVPQLHFLLNRVAQNDNKPKSIYENNIT